jgi:polysaccharide biosynthesis protein PslG
MATTLVLAALPGSAVAAEKGLQTDLTWSTSTADQDRTAQMLAPTGVQWLRLDISWRQMEAQRGTYDPATLAMTDRAMAIAENLGARVVMSVSETPSWASGSTELNAQPRHLSDFTHFMHDMAARYAGRVAAWEIWNEPNLARFWYPAPNAGQYAALLHAGASGVRAGDPGAKVMFAGLAFNDYAYLEQVYAAAPDIGKSFDIMATHPYTDNGQSPDVVNRGPDGRMTKGSFLAFSEVHDVMLAHGDNRPIWFTEFGWSTNSAGGSLGGVTEDVQAQYLARAFQILETVPYVPVAIVYELRNNYWAGDANDWEDQLGLLRTDFSPKPAYTVFKNYQPGAGTRVAQPVAAQPAPAPAPAGAPAPPQVAAPAVPATPTTARASLRTSIRIAVRRVRTAQIASVRARSRRVHLRITGRLTQSLGGRVTIVVERRAHGRWTRDTRISRRVLGTTFSHRVTARRGQRLRVRAFYFPQTGEAVGAKAVTLRA